MKLAVTETVAAPQAAVFDRLRDVDALLADLGLSSAELQRQGTPGPPQVGSVWRGTILLNGAERPIEARLTEIAPPEALRIAAQSGGMMLDALFSLAPLAEDETALAVTAEVRATSLPGKLAVQSLRLMQSRIAGKLQNRVGRLARHLEQTAGG